MQNSTHNHPDPHNVRFATKFLPAMIGVILATYTHAQAPGFVDSTISNMTKLLDLMVKIGITLSLVVFGWGITMFISSSGDAARVSKAKGIITWGLIGIAVLASLYGIVQLFKAYFGIGAGNPIRPILFR
jgi:hypothetical protein